nr:MAG TPA: hypothetical protein [Caudoviricetes sp.]
MRTPKKRFVLVSQQICRSLILMFSRTIRIILRYSKTIYLRLIVKLTNN